MALGDRRWVALAFMIGLAVSAAMVPAAQIAGDQLNLLALGWRFAFEGDWPIHGNPTSAGGFTPGSVTGPLIGLPLLLWQDHRALALLTLGTHLIAYLLLDRLVRRVLGPEARVLFAICYWLNPWRLYHSAFLWNPNFLFVFGAWHLWTAWRLRREPRFWASFGHVLALGLALEIAVHALPLALISLVLWWRGYVRLHLGGAAAAAAVIAASLAPWLAAVVADPTLAPSAADGAWFYLLNTSLRAAVYWVRYSSFALSSELFCLDYSRFLGADGAVRLEPLLEAAKGVLYYGSLPVSLWANWALWRGSGRWWRPAREAATDDRSWLEGVVRWSFVAVIAIFALSPATVSRWYLHAVFHLAVLTLVLACGRLLGGPRERLARTGAAVHGAIAVILALAMLLGAPMYRCGGERCSRAATLPELRHDHPMLEELGVQRTCPTPVNQPDGWWIQTGI